MKAKRINLGKSLIAAFAVASFAVGARSAEVVPTGEALMCTRDYNPWGRASLCECPEQSTYENRSGYCIRGTLEPVMSEGLISTGMMAIGGETTGIILDTAEQGSYELILPLSLKQSLENMETESIGFQVVGDYLEVPGVETGMRPTIIVNQLIPLTTSEANLR